MGVSKNSSEEEVVKSRKLYTGIGEFKVILVNPTMADLHDHEIMVQSEPKYTVDFGDGPLTKVAIWIKNEYTTLPVEFIMTPGPWKSKTGKFKWYNAIGQDTWGNERQDGSLDFESLHEKVQEFYKEPETAYKIPKGADTLTDFVKAWANVETDGEIFLDTINAIADGTSIKELEELRKDLVANELRILVYVRDGKYQAAYTRHFGRIKPKRDDWFASAMLEDYGEVKGEYTMKFQEYVPGEVEADPANEEPDADETDYEMAGDDNDPLGGDPLDDM